MVIGQVVFFHLMVNT